MNEVQRDRIYLREALAFIRDHTAVAARLTGAKALAYFFTGWPIYLQLIAAAAALGTFLARKRPAALILAAMIGLYAIPYVISIPYHFRYRYPIEPLLVLLAPVLGGAQPAATPTPAAASRTHPSSRSTSSAVV